jgi:hypothetical protein
MAIISGGRVLMSGDPQAAVRELIGKVWRRVIGKQELDDFQRRYTVISTRLVGGRTVIHTVSDAQPDPTFEPITASLEDVYFHYIKSDSQPQAEAA